MKRVQAKEVERKYLLNSICKHEKWQKEFIIYQWFTENNGSGSTKVKIIFDLLNLKCILVRVEKRKTGDFTWDKEITYLDRETLNPKEFLGMNFVAKRRAIYQNVFLDKFFRSNGRCRFLLEVEEDLCEQELEALGIEIGRDVSQDPDFLNANMCVPFEERDCKAVSFLLEMIDFHMEM